MGLAPFYFVIVILYYKNIPCLHNRLSYHNRYSFCLQHLKIILCKISITTIKTTTGGFEHYGPFLELQDKENQRILMDFLQKQKAEIMAQQKYREEQRKGAHFEKRLLILNTLIAIAALLISLFK